MNEAPQPKKRIRLIIPILIIVAAAAAITLSIFVLANPNGIETSAEKAYGTVTIAQQGITPATVSIKKGDSITWTNQDGADHKLVITSPNPPKELEGFGSDEAITQGGSYSFVFDASGTFTYADPASPQKIQGTIIVE